MPRPSIWRFWRPRKHVYVLKCKKRDTGQWEALAEFDEKVNLVDVKEMYDLEEECEAAQLVEYAVAGDGSKKFVRNVWYKRWKKKQLTIDDIAGGLAFNVMQFMEACDKIRSLLGSQSSADDFFRDMVRFIMLARQGKLQLPQAQQPQPQVDAETAERILREAAEEFAQANPEAAPCARPGAKCVEGEER